MTKRFGWAPYALLIPSLVYLVLFFAAPMFQSFVLALQEPSGDFSIASVERMLRDVNFRNAVFTTFVLVVLVLPVQLVLAMAMALVVNARLKGSGLWLYVYALPLGISELSAGIVWVSIFTQSGWLNSVLMGIGILERPITWQSAETPWLLIGIVVIAEAWRATSDRKSTRLNSSHSQISYA